MKTLKEQAEELVDKMYNSEHCGIKHFPNKNYCDCVEINLFQAKQCALIAVDFVIEKIRKDSEYSAKSEINWYNRMKQEIEKL